MCGIAAYLSLESREHGERIVEGALEQLHHRGPDGRGVLAVASGCAGPSIVLGHTRLAIIGSADAIQPLRWTIGKKRFYLVHNGEAYNYQQLQEQLIAERDCHPGDFRTDGDSEVLLACLSHKGINWTLDAVRGMFAFVFVECHVTEEGEQLSRAILSRDTFGIKPLSYALDARRKRVFVCSEFQAMPQDVGLKDFQDVLPSSYVEISYSGNNENSSWSFREHKFQPHGSVPTSMASLPREEQLLAIRSRLMDAVRTRIPEGVPFAVLLSGGLDSSLICRLAADLIYPETLHTFTITTSTGDVHCAVDSDSHFAKVVVADAPNIIHEEVEFRFEEGLQVLPSVVQCLETDDAAMLRAGVPLYLLSKHIAEKGFKVLLCGEGADESMAGYRLFEEYSALDSDPFSHELKRRLFNIDTSELQRVDRCTSAHGLEARVPFMDVAYVNTVMGLAAEQKMTHPSLGRIQKYLLRHAFDGHHYRSRTGKRILPDSVLYREKEQFADGVGRSWISKLQCHVTDRFPDLAPVEAECALYTQYLSRTPGQLGIEHLIQSRKERRRQGALDQKPGKRGCSQPNRWYPVRSDPDLAELNLSQEDAHDFLRQVLGWSQADVDAFSPSLESLNKAIVSMLERVPFHNLTLLTRERRPPTMIEIREDMMSGIGGPCAVVNSFFAALLDRLGFGPNVYLLSCEINNRMDCHVAILLQFKGLRYFVDVANAKPYNRAVHLGDASTFTGLDGFFTWGLRYNPESGRTELHHSGEKALSFHPAHTVPYRSFRPMIQRSRSDASFGPFLMGLRFCLYPKETSCILAVRDACVYDGPSQRKKSCAASRETLQSLAGRGEFAHIRGFRQLVDDALEILDREHPGWLERSREILHEKGIVEGSDGQALQD